jgi:hypothetical protein
MEGVRIGGAWAQSEGQRLLTLAEDQVVVHRAMEMEATGRFWAVERFWRHASRGTQLKLRLVKKQSRVGAIYQIPLLPVVGWGALFRERRSRSGKKAR